LFGFVSAAGSGDGLFRSGAPAIVGGNPLEAVSIQQVGPKQVRFRLLDHDSIALVKEPMLVVRHSESMSPVRRLGAGQDAWPLVPASDVEDDLRPGWNEGATGRLRAQNVVRFWSQWIDVDSARLKTCRLYRTDCLLHRVT
jgi:hypothetical protein